jgi:hypothetical protein
LDDQEEPEATVVADTPSLDVESSPLVPNVATRFRKRVAHGNGGVFLFPPGSIEFPAGALSQPQLPPLGRRTALMRGILDQEEML